MTAIFMAGLTSALPNYQFTIDLDLIKAVKADNFKEVETALQYGANPNTKINGDPPLIVAIDKRHESIARCLLEAGANANTTAFCYKETALYMACVRGCDSVVDQLIKKGAKVNERSLCDVVPLAVACRSGRYEIAELLLDAGADPNVYVDSTPLCEAVPYPQILKLLLKRGAEVNHPNSGCNHPTAGHTPLHQAALHGHIESVAILLKAGGNPKARDCREEIPLNLATWRLHHLNPHHSPDIAAEMTKSLEKVIRMFEEIS